jgi:capsular exopolysaccharide synthesis family protein
MASSLEATSLSTPSGENARPQTVAGPPGLSAPPSLESLWHAVRRRWVLALGLAVLGGLVAFGLAWIVVPAQYTAQTLLHLAPRANRNGLEGEDNLLNYQRTQAAMVRSYAVVQGTLERPSVADLAEVRARSDATEWLMKALTTDSLLGPEILRISLNGDRSEDLAVILNELASVYMKACASKDEAKIIARIKQLQDNYRECAEKLRERRQTLLTREEEFGLDDPDTVRLRQATTMQQLSAVQTQRVQLQLKRKENEVELTGARERVGNPEGIAISDFAITEELKQDGVMKKHFDRLTEIESQMQKIRRLAAPDSKGGDLAGFEKERESLLKTIGDYQKSVQDIIVARLRSKQVGEARDSIVKLERALQYIKEQERSLDSEVKRLEGLVSTLRGAGRPLEKTASGVETLRDEVAQMEMVLKKVGEELGNLQAELPATSRVTQMEPAKPPVARRRDRQLKVAGAAGLGLFGLVFLGVGLLEFRHRRVYTSEDVARGLGLSLLGTLPDSPDHAGVLTPAGTDLSTEHHLLTEAVDSVRTRLLHAARLENRRVVMVASAVAGEGKTSLASHLAASLARSGHRTLLIDGDLRNPAVHRRFGLPAEPGLADALRGDMPAQQLVRASSIEGLSILTAGRCDRQTLRALAQDGVKKVLDALKSDYAFIILDVCPVLPVADALLIGQHADAVLLSVLRNFSRLPAIYEAQRRLASLDIPMLGAVVLGEASASYGAERYLAEMKQ